MVTVETFLFDRIIPSDRESLEAGLHRPSDRTPQTRSVADQRAALWSPFARFSAVSRPMILLNRLSGS